MVEVPRHHSSHERAEALPLITQSARVTVREAMDRSRNREVLDAIRRQIRPVSDPEWLDDHRRGADIDWEGLDDQLASVGASNRRRVAVGTLAERFERPYPSLLRLGVRPDRQVEFAPGQYVTLRAHDVPRAYSLANSPTERDLEFSIRRVPSGRLTSELFTRAAVGDEVTVRGPNGDMVLNDPSDNDVAFLATGTGVAPFKSMIDYLFEQGWDEHGGETRDVWLFLGCGWEDDLPYQEHFRELDAEREHFHFVPSLTRESLLTEWNGETDYVQRTLLKYVDDDALRGVRLPNRLDFYRHVDPELDIEARIDPRRTNVYACGITAMVETLVTAVRAVGVPERNLQYEGFG